MAVPTPGDAASRAAGRAEGMDSRRSAARAPCLRGRSSLLPRRGTPSEGRGTRDEGRGASGARGASCWCVALEREQDAGQRRPAHNQWRIGHPPSPRLWRPGPVSSIWPLSYPCSSVFICGSEVLVPGFGFRVPGSGSLASGVGVSSCTSCLLLLSASSASLCSLCVRLLVPLRPGLAMAINCGKGVDSPGRSAYAVGG